MDEANVGEPDFILGCWAKRHFRSHFSPLADLPF
jgi:hypothetical protein